MFLTVPLLEQASGQKKVCGKLRNHYCAISSVFKRITKKLPHQRGAGLNQGFQFLYIRSSLVCLYYVQKTPTRPLYLGPPFKKKKDYEPPIKRLIWVSIRGAPDTAISRPGGYEVSRLASNMPKSPPKKRKPVHAKLWSLLLSNQKEILKRGMTETERHKF